MIEPSPRQYHKNESSSKIPTQTTDAVSRLKRGLAAYVSYLAACDMNEAFSEYVLYEPILRILRAQRYKVSCEVICHGLRIGDRGDFKRLDFHAEKDDLSLAIEVKWLRPNRSLRIESDIEKLRWAMQNYPNVRALLCIFGTRSSLEKICFPEMIGSYRERSKMTVADMRRTRYACRIFQLE